MNYDDLLQDSDEYLSFYLDALDIIYAQEPDLDFLTLTQEQQQHYINLGHELARAIRSMKK